MKIKIFLAFLINMIAIDFILIWVSKIIEKMFGANMNNTMFVLLLSLMLAGFQVIWIKWDKETWIKAMDNVFGIKISAD